MADNTEPTADEEMVAVQEKTEEEEKPTTDVEELKKAVAQDAAKTEADESAKSGAEDENAKAANNEQDEEEEYVLKDEAHEEEDNQKENEDKEVNGVKDGKDEKSESMGSTIAKHYNNIPETGKDARKQSRIFYLRNFNNWVKSVMINEFLEKAKKAKRRYDEEMTILDLGCGKGGDLLKWQKGRVDHVICADIAETSVEQCKERYDNLKKGQRGGYRESRERLFTLECLAADCTKVNLAEKFKDSEMQLDLTSCQFAFHYAFESYKQAETMIKNACEKLRPGGYFIGTTPDANELVKRLKKSEGNSFGNDVYNIEFEKKEDFDIFGTKYHFKLHEVVDCPEFLVHFPVVEKLAAKHNMRLVYNKSFHELFKEQNKDYGYLLLKMQALEGHPPRKGWSLVSDKEEAYAHVKEQESESKSGKDNVVGTMTKDEWEATGLYTAFAFEKIDPEEEARKEQREKEQKEREQKEKEQREQREKEQKEKSLKRAASPEKSEEASAPPAKKTRGAEVEKEEAQEETAQEEAEQAEEAEASPEEAKAEEGQDEAQEEATTEAKDDGEDEEMQEEPAASDDKDEE